MFNKGLFTDGPPENQPEETYRSLVGGTLLAEAGCVTQELGTLSVEVLPTIVAFYGTVAAGSRVYYFFTTAGGSEIGYVDGGVYTEVVPANSTLNFVDAIQGEYQELPGGAKYIYFTDGVNPVRRLALDRTPGALITDDELDLFPKLSYLPLLEDLTELESGGRLVAGAYQFAMAYVDTNGTPTPYLAFSTTVHIKSDLESMAASDINGSAEGEPTSKSIRLVISRDDADRFPRVRIAVIAPNGIFQLPEIAPANGDTLFTYTGSEVTLDITSEEVIIGSTTWETAKAIAQEDGRLYLGNLSKKEALGYQRYANAIEVELTLIDESNVDTNDVFALHPDDLVWGDLSGDVFTGGANDARYGNAFRTFVRDEVYAFYISFVFKDGSESEAYHIPGRASPSGVGLTELDPQTAYGITGKEFHFGTPDLSINDMGYWENENEFYPNTDDFDIWEVIAGTPTQTGSLREEPVRHHHFPAPEDSHVLGEDPANAGRFTKARILGIKLVNVTIPDEIREKVLGYKVYVADRDASNKRVLDTALLHRAGEVGSDYYPLAEDDHVGGAYPDPTVYYYTYPFHLLRTRDFAGIDFAKVLLYEEGIYPWKSATEWGGGSGETASPTDISFPGVATGSDIEWAGFVEANSVVTVGTSDTFNNTSCPPTLVLKAATTGNVEGTWERVPKVAQLRSHKVDVYNPFYAQNLIWTGCYVALDEGSDDETPAIYAGDAWVQFYGYNLVEWESDEEIYYSPAQTIVESVDNIGLRYVDEVASFPYNPISNPLDSADYPTSSRDGTFVLEERFFTNPIFYFEDYSEHGAVKTAFPWNPYYELPTDFPYRIARSIPKPDIGDGFQQYFLADFEDVPPNRGEIIKLTMASEAMLIHCRKSLMRTRVVNELQAGETRIFVTTGDILSEKPRDVFPLPEGYAGIRHPFEAAMTPFGYFFVEANGGRIFLLADGLKEISSLGISNAVRAAIDSESGPIRVCYEPHLKRLVSRLDEVVYAFDPEGRRWESSPPLNALHFYWDERDCYSIATNVTSELWKHGAGEVGMFYGSEIIMSIELVGKYPLSALVHTIQWDSRNDAGVPVCFDQVAFASDSGSGTTVLVPGTNCRHWEGVWFTNHLRVSAVATPASYPAYARTARLVGRAVRATFTKEPNGSFKLMAAKFLTNLASR